jgi:hypothetical protein
MRVRLPILILVAVLGTSLSSGARLSEDLTAGMCSAEQTVVLGVTGNRTNPDCAFNLACEQFVCVFALQVSGSAVGEAQASLFGNADRADVFVVGLGGERVRALSCADLFTCSAYSFEDDAGNLWDSLVVAPRDGFALVRMICTGGGTALFQRVNCQAKQVF